MTTIRTTRAVRQPVDHGATLDDLLAGRSAGPVSVASYEPRQGLCAAFRADGSALVWRASVPAVRRLPGKARIRIEP